MDGLTKQWRLAWPGTRRGRNPEEQLELQSCFCGSEAVPPAPRPEDHFQGSGLRIQNLDGLLVSLEFGAHLARANTPTLNGWRIQAYGMTASGAFHSREIPTGGGKWSRGHQPASHGTQSKALPCVVTHVGRVLRNSVERPCSLWVEVRARERGNTGRWSLGRQRFCVPASLPSILIRDHLWKPKNKCP